MPFIDIEELPKTKGRFVDLDEQPGQKFFKAGKEVSEQDFLSPGKIHIQSPLLAAAKGASDVIGGPFASNYYASRIPKFIGGQGLAHPEAMRYAEEVSKPIEEAKIEGIPGQIGYGLAQVAPILGGAPTPFMAGAKGLLGVASKIPMVGRLARAPIAKTALGFGGYEVAKGLVGGEADLKKSFGKGIVGGAGYHAGLRGGATLGKMLLPTKIAERVGSAAGAGAVGALSAPEGEKISSAITGAGFGAKYPGRAFGYKTPVELSKQAVDIYRNILRPTQSETQMIEVRKGKDLDNYFKLAAEENLPIKKTSENKLDTEQAREILQTKIKSTQSELNKILEKDTTNYFDLLKIGQQARKGARKQISNAKELEGAIGQINDYISAEIARHKGRTVSAASLNRIKQGMWSVGYDALRPTSQENARRIGFTAKDAIEKAYPNNIVRTLNDRSGDYITLSRLLEKAHGRVIQKGRIGEYAARGTGLIIGGAAGQLIPIPGAGMAAGAWAGHKIGGKINEYLSSPERLSKVAGKKMAESKSAGKEQLLDVAFKNLTKFPVFIPKTKSFFAQAPGQVGAKLKGKAGQAVFGKEEPQKPVFGVKPQEPTPTPIQKPIVQPAKYLLGKQGIVEGAGVKDLMKSWDNKGIESWISEKGDAITLSKIIVPEKNRGEGVGTKAMQELIDYADANGKKIYLTPTKDFGGTVERLNKFYKGSGFVKNKYYSHRETLVRYPVEGKPLTAAEAVKQGMGAEEWVGSKQPKTVKFISATKKADYMGGHEAPMAEDINNPVWDLTGKFTGNKLYPEDVYGSDATRLYSSGFDYDNQAISILHSVKNRPNARITIYRAVPKDTKDEINPGDWVAITRDYAKDHGESNLGSNFKIIKKNIFARDIFTDANSIQEFGYDPQPRLEPKDTPYELLSKAYKEGKTDLHSTYQSQLLSEYEAAKKAQGKGTTLGLAGLTAAGTIMAGQAQAEEKKTQSGEASTYGWGEKLNKHTFSGEIFNPDGLTAAMRDVPMGTIIKVTDKKTNKSVTLTVNDGGPNIRTKRVVDLSKGAWKALGYNKAGLADVDVEIIKLGTGKKFHQ